MSILDYRNGFYIEAGANDGVSQSNTIELETRLGWSGLLIEPNLVKLQECRANRSQNNIFEHCALVSKDYKSPTISGNFNEQDTNESLTSQVVVPLPYYDEHQLTAAVYKQNRAVVEVPACTLQFLIDKHSIKSIDFLSLDVEGYEFEAMDGLDFDKNPPKVIRIETSTYKYRIEKTIKYLECKRYRYLGKPDVNGINDCLFQLM